MLKTAAESQAPEDLKLRKGITAKRLALGALLAFAGSTISLNLGTERTEAKTVTEPAPLIQLNTETAEGQKAAIDLERLAVMQTLEVEK